VANAETIEHLSVGERLALTYMVRANRLNDPNVPASFFGIPSQDLRKLEDGELLKVLHRELSGCLARFANTASPRKFTLPQIWTLILAAKVRNVSYRELLRKLGESGNARAALGLRRLPDHSTLSYARKRPLELVAGKK